MFLLVFVFLGLESLLIGLVSNRNMKESRKRSVVKSIIWRIICVAVSVLTSYFLTGILPLPSDLFTMLLQ